MKKFKNALLLAIGSMTVLSVAMTSCSSSGGGGSTTASPTVTSVSGSLVAGGAITVTGTNFTTSTTSAKINGTTVAVAYVSPTSFTTTVPTPLAAGTYNLVVTVTGASSTATYSITIGLPGVGPGGIYTSSNQIQTGNVIAHWTFDNTLADDNSGLSTVSSSASNTRAYVTGKIGSAISLTNGWLTYGTIGSGHIAPSFDNTGFGSNDTLQNGYTFSVWVKLPVSPVDGGNNPLLGAIFQLNTLIDNWGGMGLAYRKQADSTLDENADFFNVDGNGPHLSYGSLYLGGALKDTANAGWAFLTVVYDTTGAITDGRSLKYYANGQLVGTKAITSANFFSNSNTEVLLVPTPNFPSFGTFQGTDQTTSVAHVPGSTTAIPGFQTNGLTGILDDARLFKTSLSAAEVGYLYQLGLQGR